MEKSKPKIVYRFAIKRLALAKLLSSQGPRARRLGLSAHSTLTVCAVVVLVTGVMPSSAPPPPPPSAASIRGTVNIADCNDPDSPLPTWICREAPKALLPPGYPYYVGHDEPEMQFYSNTPGSGNNVQWKIRLPPTDPTPDQAGTKVANRQLYPTYWFRERERAQAIALFLSSLPVAKYPRRSSFGPHSGSHALVGAQ